MADAKMIESRVDNGIAVLEINRPPVNSYTTELLKELDAAILDAQRSDLKKLWFIAHLHLPIGIRTLTYAGMPAKSFS